jgi:hypothetical protein
MTCSSRHWYAVGVRTGIHAPHCRRCGDPNPNYTAAQRREYEQYVHRNDPLWSGAPHMHGAFRQLARRDLVRASDSMAVAITGAMIDPGRPLHFAYRERGLVR